MDTVTSTVTGESADNTDLLQKTALETSKVILVRQRQMALQLKHAKSALEDLTQRQAQALSLLNATLEASPDGIVAFSMSGGLIALNTNFQRLWQLSPDMLARANPDEIRLHCRQQVTDPTLFDDSLPPASVAGTYEEVRFCDGRIVERYVSPQMKDDQQTGVVVHWQDVTKRRRADAKNNRMAQILERSLNEIYLFEQTSLRYVYANLGALTNLGLDLAALSQLTALDLMPQYDSVSFMQLVQPLLNGETALLIFETVHCRADLSIYNVQVHLQLDTNNEAPAFMALVLDITERKRAEHVIWHQANFDALTQLPNRILLQERMAHEIKKAGHNGDRLGLMFIDIDKFKEINDTRGHSTGDKLLIESARRIADCVRAGDTVARVGGDEFVILLPEIRQGHDLAGIAQKLLAVLREPFSLEGIEAVVSASIGITVFPDDADNSECLLKNADQAMYASKAQGRNQYSYFSSRLEASAHQRMKMIGELRRALKLGQLLLHFQPIVDASTGHINKAEALIRWQHPEFGLVPPADFIPLAEDTGLIIEIGNWVFSEALQWLKRWRDCYVPEFKISINKSPAQFLRNHKDHAQHWVHQLSLTGLPGNSVILEITVGLLVDPSDNVEQILLTYRDAGIQVALNDFGTGYCSLAYLQRFDIDYLKIDRSFTRHLSDNSCDLALSEAIIAMARALDLKVVAEGVETQAQLDLLTAAGCHFVQGYLFSPAVPPEEFEKLLILQNAPPD